MGESTGEHWMYYTLVPTSPIGSTARTEGGASDNPPLGRRDQEGIIPALALLDRGLNAHEGFLDLVVVVDLHRRRLSFDILVLCPVWRASG